MTWLVKTPRERNECEERGVGYDGEREGWRREKGLEAVESRPGLCPVDWCTTSGRVINEAPPFTFRRQIVADLTAAQWKLLAREDPRYPTRATFFWADVPMAKARDADTAGCDELVSQRVFARDLNVMKGLVGQGVCGEKRPRSVSLKVLMSVAKNNLGVAV